MIRANFFSKIFNKIYSHPLEFIIILSIVIFHCYFAISSKSYLIYGFIYIDEFSFTSRAWELDYFLSHGSFAYPPLFDHPPLGWILMGLFGSILTGIQWAIRTRIFIVVLFTIEIGALYGIVSRLFSRKVALISVIIFGFQPYFIYLKTLSIIDNIGMFFITLGIFFLLKAIPQSSDKATNKPTSDEVLQPLNKKYFYISALSVGCALITKFPMILFVPGFIFLYLSVMNNYGLIFQKKEFKKQIRTWFIWLVLLFTPFSIYIIVTIIMGQLGTLLWNIEWQSTRNMEIETFLNLLNIWFQEAPVILAGVLFIPFIIFFIYLFKIIKDGYTILKKRTNQQLLISKIGEYKQRNNIGFKIFASTSFIVFYMAFIYRGGIVFFHYFIPIITFSTIMMAGFCYKIEDYFEKRTKKNDKILDPTVKTAQTGTNKVFLQEFKRFGKKIKKERLYLFEISWIAFCMLPLGYSWLFEIKCTGLYQALDYIDENIPRDSNIIVNEFFIAELREMGFQYVQLIWFVSPFDYGNDWRNIDYFIASGLHMVTNSFTEEAIDHCVEIASFQMDNSTTERIRIYQVIP